MFESVNEGKYDDMLEDCAHSLCCKEFRIKR